jgi:peptide methionine sulfoxide reductase MsrA
MFQYSSFIYFHDDEQKEKAAASLKAAEAGKNKTFLTKIIQATEFYEAEE